MARFEARDRVSWTATERPVGVCVSWTREVVLFTFCPPFPDARENVSVIEEGGRARARDDVVVEKNTLRNMKETCGHSNHPMTFSVTCVWI